MRQSRQIKRAVIQAELEAQKLANKLSLKQRQAIRYNLILTNKQLDQLLINAGTSPTSYSAAAARVELMNFINRQYKNLTATQTEEIEHVLNQIYRSSGKAIGNAVGINFDFTTQQQMDLLGNQSYQTKVWAERLAANNSNLAERVNKDIGRMVMNQMSPEEIKKVLAADYKMTYNSADRIIRTESSRYFNQAAQESYKQAGIIQVEYLAETDACEDCSALDGKLYDINEATPVPQHPNCRCTILPVIDN